MLKLKLMFATILSTAAIAVLSSSISAKAVDSQINTNISNSLQQDSTLTSTFKNPIVFSGLEGGIIIGSLASNFYLKNVEN